MAQTLYLSPIALIVQFFQNLGLMAAGATLNTYVAGSVSTPATTYTDSTGIVANANPMTLSSTGRPVAPGTGAPVSFWTLPGVALKLVVTDSQGNQLVTLDNISSINDLTSVNNALQTLLASAASSNVSGAGPVAGADLVANAVKSYDVFADVRAANAPVMTTGQTLNVDAQGGVSVGDALGGLFYWSSSSTATDDGRNVLKPNSVASASAGRYLRIFALGDPQSIVKPSDQAIVSSTTLTADSVLALSLVANATYLIQSRLLLQGTGGTGQGWKAELVYSGSLPAVNGGGGVQSGNGTAAALVTQIGTVVTNAAIGTTSPDVLNLDLIIATGSSGSLSVLFAQNSSSANATSMKQGSTLIAIRLG